MKKVNAIMKEKAVFQKNILKDGKIKTVYKTVKAGEKVICLVYPTQNYFVGIPYYNTITEDDFSCFIAISAVTLENTIDENSPKL